MQADRELAKGQAAAELIECRRESLLQQDQQRQTLEQQYSRLMQDNNARTVQEIRRVAEQHVLREQGLHHHWEWAETLLQQRCDDLVQGLLLRVDAVLEGSVAMLRHEPQGDCDAPDQLLVVPGCPDPREPIYELSQSEFDAQLGMLTALQEELREVQQEAQVVLAQAQGAQQAKLRAEGELATVKREVDWLRAADAGGEREGHTQVLRQLWESRSTVARLQEQAVQSQEEWHRAAVQREDNLRVQLVRGHQQQVQKLLLAVYTNVGNHVVDAHETCVQCACDAVRGLRSIFQNSAIRVAEQVCICLSI